MIIGYKKLISVCLSVTVVGYIFLFSRVWESDNRNHLLQNENQLFEPRNSRKEYINNNQIVSAQNDKVFSETVADRCLRWKKDIELPELSVTPLIPLDPNRVIYSGNLNGPSNELISLQEAIFTGILTNRTVVVPRFVPHEVDNERGDEKPVPAAWRVDVGLLSKFVSMVSIPKMKQICNSSFDVGFQNHEVVCTYDGYINNTCEMSLVSRHQNLFSWEKYNLMETALDENGKKCDGLDALPVVKIGFFRKIPILSRMIESDLPCALSINSYCTYGKAKLTNFDEVLLQKARVNPTSLTRQDLATTSRDTIAKLVEIFTRRPTYVREIAQEFLKDVMRDSRYIAIHWRYNEEWENFHCLLKKKECALLEHVDSNSVAAAIVHLSKNFTKWMNIEDSDKKCSHQHVINTYLSSAAKDYDVVKSTAEDVSFQDSVVSRLHGSDKRQSRCWKIKVFNRNDLYNFIETKYPMSKCDSIWRDKHELISLVENELCKISTVFVHSSSSSWSKVAYQARLEKANFPSKIVIWDVIAEINNPPLQKFTFDPYCKFKTFRELL